MTTEEKLASFTLSGIAACAVCLYLCINPYVFVPKWIFDGLTIYGALASEVGFVSYCFVKLVRFV